MKYAIAELLVAVINAAYCLFKDIPFILKYLEWNSWSRTDNDNRLVSQTRSLTTATVQWTPTGTNARRRKCKCVCDSCLPWNKTRYSTRDNMAGIGLWKSVIKIVSFIVTLANVLAKTRHDPKFKFHNFHTSLPAGYAQRTRRHFVYPEGGFKVFASQGDTLYWWGRNLAWRSRQTDRQTDVVIAILCTPAGGEVKINK